MQSIDSRQEPHHNGGNDDRWLTPTPTPLAAAGPAILRPQSLTTILDPNCIVASLTGQGENKMVNKLSGIEQAAAVLRSARDVQAALDQAEAAHRSALAAYRRSGDALLELTHAVRSWPVKSDGVVRTADHRPPTHSVPPMPPQAEPAQSPVQVTIRQAIEISGMARTTIYREVGAGNVAARKMGKRTLIEYASLKAGLDSLPPWTCRPGTRR